MPDAGAAEAKSMLDVIATAPRAAGSSQESTAREFCADWLRGAGLHVTEEAFTYSAFAGRVATPLAGLLLASTFLLTPHFMVAHDTGSAAVVFAAHLLVLSVVAALATGGAILRLPLMTAHSVNLMAQAPDAAARLWLVAHLDSKSQPVSILARGAAISLLLLLAVALTVLVVVQLVSGAVPDLFWYAIAVAGFLASLPVMCSIVRNRSCGALDNASGVVAVMLAARQLHDHGIQSFGVLLSSAEELGLAGAQAWCRQRPAGVALNCDSVDDDGWFLCLRGRGTAGGALAALRAAASEGETRLLERRMLTGILVDSMALEAMGWDAVTLCRGNLMTLKRIHTAHDVAEHCDGSGSAAAAVLIARTAEKILQSN